MHQFWWLYGLVCFPSGHNGQVPTVLRVASQYLVLSVSFVPLLQLMFLRQKGQNWGTVEKDCDGPDGGVKSWLLSTINQPPTLSLPGRMFARADQPRRSQYLTQTDKTTFEGIDCDAEVNLRVTNRTCFIRYPEVKQEVLDASNRPDTLPSSPVGCHLRPCQCHGCLLSSHRPWIPSFPFIQLSK